MAHRSRRRRPATRARRGSGLDSQTRELLGLGLVALAIFLAVSLFLGFGAGPVGGWLEDGTRLLVGRAVALVPLALIALGVALILDHALLSARPMRLGLVVGSVALLVALAAGSLGLGGTTRQGWFESHVVKERGGFVGEAGYWATNTTVGGVGTAILVVLGLLAAVVLISGASMGHAVRRGGQGARTASRSVGRGVSTATVTAIRSSQRLRERLDALEPPTLVGRRRAAREDASRPLLDGADDFPDLFDGPSAMPPSPALAPEGLGTSGDPFSTPPSRIGLAGSDAAGEEQMALADEAPELEPVFAPRPTRTPGGRGVAPKPRRLPPRGLLRRSSGPTAQPEELIARTSRLLEEALGHFGIEAKVSDTVSGPRVTRYELQLAPGTKVGRITALRDDLAYALAAREELRIIAPIPGSRPSAWRCRTPRRPS